MELFDITKMTDEEILKSIIFVAPIFQSLAKEDFMMDICDTEKWLAHFPGKNVDVELTVGSPIPKEDVVIQGALKGNNMSGRPPFEVYNVHFFGKTMPIRNGRGKIIGALGIGYNIEDIVEIERTIVQLENLLVEVNKHTDKIKLSAGILQSSNEVLFENTAEVRENTVRIGSILDIIKRVSGQTNLLGINASIEAARAGEHGRGFSVVADEIRKLSEETAKASTNIYDYTKNIEVSVEALVNSLGKVNESVEGNSETVEDFSEISRDLTNISRALTQSVKKILE